MGRSIIKFFIKFQKFKVSAPAAVLLVGNDTVPTLPSYALYCAVQLSHGSVSK